MTLKIINGPNLNLLGTREPEIYGVITFNEHLEKIKKKYSEIGITYFQSNSEGAIIDELQKKEKMNGIILNAGAYSHYSIAIRDTIKAIDTPIVEVHLSNIFGREEFRAKSVISEVCTGIISGFGLYSYNLAIEYLINM